MILSIDAYVSQPNLKFQEYKSYLLPAVRWYFTRFFFLFSHKLLSHRIIIRRLSRFGLSTTSKNISSQEFTR